MSKGMNTNLNMLRTRRKDNNVKPNRRLDRKSSRGMIYENEELRLKTININAEIERGQSDIKKLKRENDMLKKEIWCLRDEYEKLDKLLKEKDIDFSASSSTTCTSDSESTSSYTEESVEVETSQNIENVHKTNNMNSLQSNFDLLSIVPEENSTDYNSEKLSTEREVIKADQCYPAIVGSPPQITHFFSPLPSLKQHNLDYCSPYKSAADILLKTDNNAFRQTENTNYKTTAMSSGSFSTGGNLEELLNDIENISHDILQLSNSSVNKLPHNEEQPILTNTENDQRNVGTNSDDTKEYKSELSVVLMPKPMPLIGFEKYRLLQRSAEHVGSVSEYGFQDPWNNGHHRSCDNMQQLELISLGSSPQREEQVVRSPSVSYTRLNDNVRNDFVLHESRCSGLSRIDITGSSTQLQTQIPPQVPDLPILTTEPTQLCNGDIKHIPNGQPLNDNKQSHHRENVEHLQFCVSSNGNLTSNQQNPLQSSTEHSQQPQPYKDSGGSSRLSGIRKKVSIHFRGRKERDKAKKQQANSGVEIAEANNNNSSSTSNQNNSSSVESGNGQMVVNRLTGDGTSGSLNVAGATDGTKNNGISQPTPTIIIPPSATPRVSISASPERRKQQQQLQKDRERDTRRHRRRQSHNRRSSAVSGLSVNYGPNLERSYSVCSSHNNQQQHQHNSRGEKHHLDDLLLYSMAAGGGMAGSRSSSASSIRSVHSVRLRRLSSNGTGGAGGKLPWCACWGNGCL